MPVRTPGEVFAQQLRKTRERKGWSQRDLAARLTEMGASMHQTAIAKIENGERKVTLDDAIRIAAALDVSPLSLLLPRDDEEQVALASSPEALHFKSHIVRSWITGPFGFPLTAFAFDGPVYRTIDGKLLSEAEAKERQRFYESEVSDREWRIRQVPGLSHLRLQVQRYIEQVAVGADVDLRKLRLKSIAAEVERQLVELDAEGTV